MLLLCCRQSGKSTVAGAMALLEALLRPSLILLLAPTQRQAGELYKAKVLPLYNALGRPVPAVQESAMQMTLENGSRLIALPSDEEGVRCYSSVRLLVVDEASRVPADLYRAVRPMLAVSRGRLVCLSTPFGRRGFFHDEWAGAADWKRVKITADQCPRIDPDFLEDERRALGEKWYRQEYFCSWEDLAGSVFSSEEISDSISDQVEPLALGI
jgi:hypothetical protein